MLPFIAAAAQIGSSIIGGIQASGARDEAKQAAMRAFKQFEELGYPPDQSAPLVLEQLKQQGLYDPQLEEGINLGVSQVSQIQEDPGLKDAQMSALDMLRQRSGQGYTAQERMAANKIRNQIAADTQGKIGQIQQNLQARGMGGSGAELAATLQAAQSGAGQAQEEGDRISAAAAQNALQAMGMYGNLGGQIRGQDFDIANTKAGAADAISRFNTEQSIGRQQRNIGAQNAAQAANLAEKQRVADVNAGMSNAEKLRQLQAKEQLWQNKMSLAGAKSNAALGQASRADQQARDTATSWQNVGAGVGQAGQSIYDKYAKDKAKDEEVAKSAVSKLLGK
jgi:hypothetical protein